MNTQTIALGDHGKGSIAALGTKELDAVKEITQRVHQLVLEYRGNDLSKDMWFKQTSNKDGSIKVCTVYLGISEKDAVLWAEGDSTLLALTDMLGDWKLNATKQLEDSVDSKLGVLSKRHRRG